MNSPSQEPAIADGDFPAVTEALPSGGRERPILFSAPMIRALLAGTKTQTRRIVKGDKPGQVLDWLNAGFNPAFVASPENGLCPYGRPGDALWVRETCRAEELSRPPQPRPATPKERDQLGRTSVIELDELDGADGVRYLADNAWRKIENTPEAGDRWSDLYHYDQKRRPRGSNVPSIHMPRWASRITLKITDVRVERLNEISKADAEAEGLVRLPASGRFVVAKGDQYFGSASHDPREVYSWLWEDINGEGSWSANPWVWAVTFEIVGGSGVFSVAPQVAQPIREDLESKGEG